MAIFLGGGGVGRLGTFWGEGWVDVGGWGIVTKEKKHFRTPEVGISVRLKNYQMQKNGNIFQ